MHDPRMTPARPDLAAKYLEGKVKAARFVTGETFEIVDAIAPVRMAPSSRVTVSNESITSVSNGGSLIEGPGNANVRIAVILCVGFAAGFASARSGSQPT